MHHLPRFFAFHNSKRTEVMDPKRSRRKPRLERRNAVKHIDYDAASSSSSLDDFSASSFSPVTRSLDLSDRTSFRIEGIDGEFDRICRSLGLSGPEDFAIPTAAWEASKIRTSSDVLPGRRLQWLETKKREDEKDSEVAQVGDLGGTVVDGVRVSGGDAIELTRNEFAELNAGSDRSAAARESCCGTNTIRGRDASELAVSESAAVNVYSLHVTGGGGIKGIRPPALKPPPAMTLPAIDHPCSTWDLLRGLAPESETVSLLVARRGLESSSDEEDGEEEEERVVGGIVKREDEDDVLRIGETPMLSESCSFTTSNDDDSSSTTTEPMSNISPVGRFKRTITCWDKGDLLGRGSFGSVYEGISDDGFFFAVKEVSLLDQGSQGKQCIYQLEQEIALLSQFEHENIVQYYGTDKDESNLYIFLELVTKGSLLNLYKTYNLKDSQVSAYTRQILHGLKYLHDRNVVHRDIKCANILVDASGSVKLADFGLAKATKLNDVKSCKGTAFWMAPEVVNRKTHGYGLPADIWSLGCTVLEMLTHQIPYSDLEWMQAMFKIGRGVPPSVPDSLSKDATDFISQCLQVNPDFRPTACQLLDHPFVKRPLSSSSGSASPHLGRRS